MNKTVNTALGPISVEAMGKTLVHEHFWFTYAGWYGNTLYVNDRKEMVKIGVDLVERVRAFGVNTICDPTGLDCGRMPDVLKEIADITGFNIIFSTGYSYEAEGGAAYFRWKNAIGQGYDELFELYMTEITEGVGRTGPKPGFIKVGTSLNKITPYEEMNLRVAAHVSRETGVPIASHTEEGTMGPDIAKFLISEGADPKKIVLYHMCGNSDVKYHKRCLSQGVWSSFDRFGVQGFVGCPMDEDRSTMFMGLIGTGYIDQLLMSQDMVNLWLGKPPAWPQPMIDSLANWSSTHIFERIIPAMQSAGLTDAQVDKILIENPKKLFS
ncbi:phosphotriesterase family protein [Paracoccus versutus]|uniref:Phosphotriesterase-related protein n=1 Tax=Paracoccus versutus TaxID=34007 RepID=A0A3D9XSH0_PARVE|nr:phosphotriesterase-related protein [Paracoccus versutus]REF73394.1 phosphotriesterase-related protein [Paracoccus versutus]WGR54586.1 phosphotriesterase-related protein [Paracoccus versutus]